MQTDKNGAIAPAAFLSKSGVEVISTAYRQLNQAKQKLQYCAIGRFANGVNRNQVRCFMLFSCLKLPNDRVMLMFADLSLAFHCRIVQMCVILLFCDT